MNLNKNYLYSLSDQFIFWNLKKITNGYLQLTDSTGKEYFFGDAKSSLKVKIKINHPSFSFKLLRKGLPNHLHGRFIFKEGEKYSTVTIRGLGLLENDKLLDQLGEWLTLMYSEIILSKVS